MNYNCLVASDWHLGNPRTPTSNTLASLDKLLFRDPGYLSKIDIFFIPGDVFDRDLKLSQGFSDGIHKWVEKMLRACKASDVMVRVLEGTNSHDRGQSKIFTTVNDTAKIGCELRHVERLEIEHIDKFGIDVLYLPDEHHPDHHQILSDVKSKMDSHGLQKVDFIIMHGMFDYQVPYKGADPSHYHDSKAFNKLVRKYCISGHIHQGSRRDKILVPGSVDRHTHGDEGSKGFLQIEVNSKLHNDDDVVTVIENPLAAIYRTLNCVDMDVVEGMDYIRSEVGLYHGKVAIRLKLTSGSALATTVKSLEKEFRNIVWDYTTVVEDKTEEVDLEDFTIEQGIEITPANIKELLTAHMKSLSYPEEAIVKSLGVLDRHLNKD